LSDMVKLARFSFLTAGPTIVFHLPADFDETPELSSPVANPNGARSVDFLPLRRDFTDLEGYSLSRTFIDAFGRAVHVYRWPFEPAQWFLRWRLSSGSVWTHLREEDGEEMADLIVGCLTVIEEEDTHLPFVLIEAPLRRAVSSRPGYQEFASFFSPMRPEWSVTFLRPSYLSEGEIVVKPDGRQAVVRVGCPLGLEAQVVAGSDAEGARSFAESICGSVVEAATL